jgi:hypothetical protein
MRRIWYLLKKIILIAALASAGWYGYRYTMETDADRQMAKAYLPLVHATTGTQVRDLILSGARNNRVSLLYVFDTSSPLSRWHYSDIMAFADKYNRTQLNILMVAVDEDPLDVAELVYKQGGSKLHMLVIQPPGKTSLDNLYAEIYRLGGKSFELGNYPYIAVVNKAGHIEKVPFGFNRKNKISGLIDRSLNPKN